MTETIHYTLADLDAELRREIDARHTRRINKGITTLIKVLRAQAVVEHARALGTLEYRMERLSILLSRQYRAQVGLMKRIREYAKDR